jgi:cystathionine beta-lyase
VQVNTPVYPPFLWTPRTAGMRVLSVPLRFEEARQDWVMDYDAMEALVTPKTRMFVLCNPHNPVSTQMYRSPGLKAAALCLCIPVPDMLGRVPRQVGKVFSPEELRRLGDFCKRHDLVLCSDEIHCDLVLSEERRHTPLAALQDPALLARSITLHAPSKTYNGT